MACEEFKNCPCCGAEAHMVVSSDYEEYMYWLELGCTSPECGLHVEGNWTSDSDKLSGFTDEYKQDLINKWNRRT